MNEGQLSAQVRRDSPWWATSEWAQADPDLTEAAASGISYHPSPLGSLAPDGLYLLYGPRRVGKTVSTKRAIEQLLRDGVDPKRIVRVAADGWKANDLGMLYQHVTRVATRQLGDASRYWFIDEITATSGEWWSILKNLRDNTSLRSDCVVLTGSSNAGLDEAVKALAGRRGSAVRPDRAVLPMGFGDFCQSIGSTAPAGSPLRPSQLRSRTAAQRYLELYGSLDDLSAAWQIYLEVGSYPRAVSDFHRTGEVSASFCEGLWDVIRGEAINKNFPEVFVLGLFAGLARRLSSTINIAGFADDLGLSREALAGRMETLRRSFVIWPCYAASSQLTPDLNRQAKMYFSDPLLSRLAHLIAPGHPDPDITVRSENGIALALARTAEQIRPGSFRSAGSVMYFKPKRAEIDFVGIEPDTGVGFMPTASKYISGSWRREALSISNSIGQGVLATRDILSVDDDDPVWAVPACFLAYCLAPPGPATASGS